MVTSIHLANPPPTSHNPYYVKLRVPLYFARSFAAKTGQTLPFCPFPAFANIE
jgi:hypothetical protein